MPGRVCAACLGFSMESCRSQSQVSTAKFFLLPKRAYFHIACCSPLFTWTSLTQYVPGTSSSSGSEPFHSRNLYQVVRNLFGSQDASPPAGNGDFSSNAPSLQSNSNPSGTKSSGCYNPSTSTQCYHGSGMGHSHADSIHSRLGEAANFGGEHVFNYLPPCQDLHPTGASFFNPWSTHDSHESFSGGSISHPNVAPLFGTGTSIPHPFGFPPSLAGLSGLFDYEQDEQDMMIRVQNGFPHLSSHFPPPLVQGSMHTASPQAAPPTALPSHAVLNRHAGPVSRVDFERAIAGLSKCLSLQHVVQYGMHPNISNIILHQANAFKPDIAGLMAQGLPGKEHLSAQDMPHRASDLFHALGSRRPAPKDLGALLVQEVSPTKARSEPHEVLLGVNINLISKTADHLYQRYLDECNGGFSTVQVAASIQVASSLGTTPPKISDQVPGHTPPLGQQRRQCKFGNKYNSIIQERSKYGPYAALMDAAPLTARTFLQAYCDIHDKERISSGQVEKFMRFVTKQEIADSQHSDRHYYTNAHTTFIR